MKVLSIVMAIILLLTPVSAWAATASATVSATIASVCSISITRDGSSVSRGSAGTILFDKRDDQDRTGGDPAYMYAPYQSETGKNWHVVSIAANGSTMSLSASVTGTIGTIPLANILQLWCGGFFAIGSTSGCIPGTPSTNWDWANGWRRDLSQPFTGVVPFSYRLNISEIAAGGPYTGTITFTVTST